MTGASDRLELARCGACHARFLPADGPCPRCASPDVTRYGVEPLGTVLAATELTVPPAGWDPPHRLVLVEVADAVRILGVAGAELPSVGSVVAVRREGEVYRILGPSTIGSERGEGDSPKVRADGPSFEPPR